MTWEMLYVVVVATLVVSIAYSFYRYKNGMVEEHRDKMERKYGDKLTDEGITKTYKIQKLFVVVFCSWVLFMFVVATIDIW